MRFVRFSLFILILCFLIVSCVMDHDNKSMIDVIDTSIISQEEVIDLSSELMYRFHLSLNKGKVIDFADIIEINEDTELFLFDLQLEVLRINNGVKVAPESVYKDKGEIIKTLYNYGSVWKGIVRAHTICISSTSNSYLELLLYKDKTGVKIIGIEFLPDDNYYSVVLKPQVNIIIMEEEIDKHTANIKAFEKLKKGLEGK